MDGIDGPDDVRVQVRMGEGEAHNKLHGRHAVEQVIEVCVLPPLPLHPRCPFRKSYASIFCLRQNIE